MTSPNPVPDTMSDVIARLEHWANYCLDRAIDSSIDAFYRQSDLPVGDDRAQQAVDAERRATFHYGYVQALQDLIERLRQEIR